MVVFSAAGAKKKPDIHGSSFANFWNLKSCPLFHKTSKTLNVMNAIFAFANKLYTLSKNTLNERCLLLTSALALNFFLRQQAKHSFWTLQFRLKILIFWYLGWMVWTWRAAEWSLSNRETLCRGRQWGCSSTPSRSWKSPPPRPRIWVGGSEGTWEGVRSAPSVQLAGLVTNSILTSWLITQSRISVKNGFKDTQI